VTFESLRINYLRGLAGFAAFSDADLAALVTLADECEVDTGEILASEGTTPPQAFLVIEGTGSATMGGQVVGQIECGQLIGPDGSGPDKTSSATVTALTPMRLLVMGPAAFRAFMTMRGIP
jgi:CRP-like cAMP-binding protein